MPVTLSYLNCRLMCFFKFGKLSAIISLNLSSSFFSPKTPHHLSSLTPVFRFFSFAIPHSSFSSPSQSFLLIYFIFPFGIYDRFIFFFFRFFLFATSFLVLFLRFITLSFYPLPNPPNPPSLRRNFFNKLLV